MATFAPTDLFGKLDISEQQLKAHKLRLANAADIRSLNKVDQEVEDENETKKKIFRKFPPPSPGPTPAFDANYFGPIVHDFLKDKVMGYAYQVYQGSSAIYTGVWNWAKNPNDGDKGWTVDTRMHIASTSKLMTAIGLVKLLDKKSITLDTSISSYLPSYWRKGSGVAQVTFRKLLNHTSGFSGKDSRCDYEFMKEQIAKGPNVSPGTYANVNFSLMRVLITIIDGRVSSNANYGVNDDNNSLLDSIWDIVTTKYFQEYMNREVFSVVGLPTIGFSPQVGGPTAMAYSSMTDVNGRDGDWSIAAGGAGFYMSITQILKTMDGYRSGKIISASRAQYMLDNYLGNNTGVTNTPAGKVYTRLGSWSINDGEEQTAVYCLPNNTNIAFFVNSPVKGFLNGNGDNQHIHHMISPAIQASIH